MSISVLDLFTVGIGPSSSHTVGPMLAAKRFAEKLAADSSLELVSQLKIQLYGSLGATGRGHGTPKAVVLGLMGEHPESVDVDTAMQLFEAVKSQHKLELLKQKPIVFNYTEDLILHRQESLPEHANGMRFDAYDQAGDPICGNTYYSIGGGFVLSEAEIKKEPSLGQPEPIDKPYAFTTGAELLAHAEEHQLSISELMLANEAIWRPQEKTQEALLHIWQVMQQCVITGLSKRGELPGGLRVARRAYDLHQQLLRHPEKSLTDPLTILDWVSLYALAVNEENAAGGRVVTAPTNGAAGIIPAVLHYYTRFSPNANDEGVVQFLLTAGAIGILYKENASISGAEVGCQGEVGSACSMAAGALAEVLGGSPKQVGNAAEIAMEHNLGLTCDPIGGLVQIPCIERNAMASVKAIHAARMALRGDGEHFVSLDKVIRTMRDTGRDMQDKYKETARGGLAVSVMDVPVNIVEC